MAVTSNKRHTMSYYWCAQWTDEFGMISEAGNCTSMEELVVWLAARLDSLPKGEGKLIRKKV